MDLIAIQPTTQLGRDVQISADDVRLGRNVRIGDRVRITASRLVLGDNVTLDADVSVRADSFELRAGAALETRCLIAGMGGRARHVDIGEQTRISHDCKVLAPAAVIGDYSALHNHTLINGRKPVAIGHNVWIGQNCILNSEERLTIGNNVGIGTYSSIYTHGYFGDLLEGCQVFKVAPVVIEDDAWILGSYNIIPPGITLGPKSLVLTGSHVMQNVPANHTVSGAPARDVTALMQPFHDVTVGDKISRMREFLAEYVATAFPSAHEATSDGYLVTAASVRFRVMLVPNVGAETHLPGDRPLLVFAGTNDGLSPPTEVTVFDLAKRCYTRTRTPAEIGALMFFKSYRARFVPTDRPRIELPSEFRE